MLINCTIECEKLPEVLCVIITSYDFLDSNSKQQHSKHKYKFVQLSNVF